VNLKLIEILMLLRLPARLTAEVVAVLLGFHPDAINYLADIGFLKTLGESAPGSCRMFSSSYIEGLRADIKWLDKATNKVRQHTRERNFAAKEKKLPAVTGKVPKPNRRLQNEMDLNSTAIKSSTKQTI
jgi:hypothetical protein